MKHPLERLDALLATWSFAPITVLGDRIFRDGIEIPYYGPQLSAEERRTVDRLRYDAVVKQFPDAPLGRDLFGFPETSDEDDPDPYSPGGPGWVHG